MEELQSARRSSGIYDAHYEGSHPSIATASSASLRGNAVPFSRTTAAGVPVVGWSETGDHASHIHEEHNEDNTQPENNTTPAAPAAPPRPPIYKRRWFIISNIILIPVGIALLFIILFPVIGAIIQHVMNVAVLNVQSASISQPQNDTFQLGLNGFVSHTSIFSSTIQFTQPITVSWLDGDNVVPLGMMNLSTIHTSGKTRRAEIDETTTFAITDENAFGRFTAVMITSQNFTWRLQSDNLKIQALKFPTAHGIKFNKDIILNGINNFAGEVILKDLELPSDNPQGGINFKAVTELNNASPFSLNLGTVIFNLTYKNVFLGQGTGTNTNLVNGTNDITLEGILVPHTSASELALVSELFTNYINGDTSPVIATGQSTLQADGTAISWLSQGLQSLSLDVPFKAFVPINPIQSISIGDLSLQFSAENPWAPKAESNSVQATMKLPFGFSLSVSEIQNDFNITKNGSTVAGLSTPIGASQSAVKVLSPADTEGQINITIANSSLICVTEDQPNFSAFNTELTTSSFAEFYLVGHSRAVANMNLGQITLNPIKVNVSTGLNGLRGLNGYTTIGDVDVLGGTQEALTLSINVSIFNPSQLNLDTGDLLMQLHKDGANLGTALLSNLKLNMGNNSMIASLAFQANDSPQGLQTLNDFVGKNDVSLTIGGFSGSTNVTSLLQAFETVQIPVTLPGLTTNLLGSAALKVLPTTGIQNNISHVTVDLHNPFTAGFKITQISSSVKAFGIALGSIQTSTSFAAAGKSTTTSPALDLDMNFDPPSLFTVTRALAVEAGLNVAPLDGIVQLGGYQYLSVTPENSLSPRQSRDNLYTGWDLPSFVQAAFKQLTSDVDLTASITIGDYQTTLQYAQTSVPTVTDDSLDYILPVLAQPIVQKIVSGAVLAIDTVLITDPQQNSFGTTLVGSITQAGPFDATISFSYGLTVTWSGKPLGTLKMADVKVQADVGASINTQSTFQVVDVDHLTDFTKTLLTEESFDWEISGDNLTVSALGIKVPGISLSSKKVTLKGMNGLKGGVKVNSFDLPANDPAGGIHLTIQTSVTNPSQVGVSLSSIAFDTYFGNTLIALVVSSGAVTLSPSTTISLPLVGRLIPQTSSDDLGAVSQVFNNFIQGKDSDVTVDGASAGASDITWLNTGIKSLEIATSLPNQGKLDIIKSVNLNQLELLFTPDTAYGPATSSNSTTAAFGLPFAFPIDITALEQNITVGYQGTSFAELAVPKGPSTTDVQSRIIHLTFKDVPFAGFGDKHSTFDQFVAATTVGGTQVLQLSGNANADAQTAVGLLSLSGIAFSVDSNIEGLQGLKTKPALVSNLDVAHGYPDYLLITVDTSLFNPSNLTIGTDEVSFTLQFEDHSIGSADISGLIIVPGNASYKTDVHYAPQGAAQSAGRDLLQNYLQGTDSSTTIVGNTDSTSIQSLKSALSQISLSPVTIPALHQSLISSASLTFPPNIVSTSVASTTFTIANPFTASINLVEITATATYHNLTLGKINHVNEAASPIHAAGHSNITSPALPLKFNLDPVTIVQLLALTSQANHVDIGPLAQLFQIVLQNPGFKSSIVTSVDTKAPTCVSGKQFDVNNAILNSLKGLHVDLAVETSVRLDDYATDLAFNQLNVPAITDETALYLIGAVAPPIAQGLVDGANLAFTEANITNLSDDGFDLSLHGALTNIGPLDALITFVEPVTITWQGNDVATITLPPVCAAANDGVPNYSPNAHLTVTNNEKFTEFAISLLHNPSFDWTVSTKKLRLEALGTIFDNVSLSKQVTFKAFNGIPGVTISNFQLPGDDPAGGIHIETDSDIPSQAQLGIDLGTVGFNAYFEDTFVGPLSGSNLFLAANTVTKAHLTGHIVPQSGSNLDTIGKLFSQYLAGGNQTLTVKGDFVQPSGSNSPVGWLSAAFKTLSLDVILPGQKLTVIQSIELSDLSVIMKTQDQAFEPLASSSNTLAQYKNPFGFSLQVVQSAVDLILGSGNVDIAELKLPTAPTIGGISTGNVADLTISFHEQPLHSLNNGAFQALLAQVTDKDTAQVNLSGTADVSARTSIGDVPIAGIPFNVQSSLKGINAFGGTASLSDVKITGSGGNGGNEFVVAPLTTMLQNPSNVSLDTIDIALPVYYQNVMIGRAAIDTFNLVPGENDVQTEFHYEPSNANDTVAQSFLTKFLQSGDTLPLSIKGDASSSPFASLQPALEGLQLSTSLTRLSVPPIITHVFVELSLSSLSDNLVDVSFDIHNPLDVDLQIQFAQGDAKVEGTTYAHFDQAFSGFVVPPGQTVNSGTFGNVLLTQGALNSLGIIPLGMLDVFAATTALVGESGYQIPWLQITQLGVPTTYDLELSLSALKQKLTAPNSASTSISVQSSTTSSAASSSAAPLTSVGSSDKPASTEAAATLAASSDPSATVSA